jgi:DNA-binding NtrC family response regulator
MNLLLIDNEIDQLQSLKRALKSKGYFVFEALGAEEGLECLDRMAGQIDLVLTDYDMSGMDGLELLKRIRNRYGPLPVILVSGHAERKMLIEAIRQRCDGFVEKPFTLFHLVEEIERVADLRVPVEKKNRPSS